MKKVLILGASGFLGSHLAVRLKMKVIMLLVRIELRRHFDPSHLMDLS